MSCNKTCARAMGNKRRKMLRSTAIFSILLFLGFTLSACAGGVSALPPQQQPPLSSTPPPPPATGSITINSLAPNSVNAGSADLTLNITGTKLDLQHSGSPQQTRTYAIWSAGGVYTSLVATVVNSTQITAVIPSVLLAVPTRAEILVEKWFKADEAPFAVSNSLVFTVTVGATPSIVPAVETLGLNGSCQFVATGFEGNAPVNWSIEEGVAGGSITANGYYTAPSSTGTFHVIATTVADVDGTATASVTVTHSGFAPAGTMHVPRAGHIATLLNDGKVLIVGGGDATAELYDPATETFSFTGPPVTGRLGATGTLLSDGRVLIAGGLALPAGSDGFLSLLDTAEIFDPVTGTFSSTGTMVTARRGHTATLLADGRVLVAGGYSSHICFTASAELFDLATGMFSPTGL